MPPMYDSNSRMQITTMSDIFRKQFDVKLPNPNRVDKGEEQWVEHKGVVECPTCHNVHFLKEWHASLKELLGHLDKKSVEISEKKQCPACALVENNLFNSELHVEHIPAEYMRELLNLVENFMRTALGKDPQDRMVRKEQKGDSFRITFTETETADQLGKKIHHAFAKTKAHYTHVPGPHNVDRVRVMFGQESV